MMSNSEESLLLAVSAAFLAVIVGLLLLVNFPSELDGDGPDKNGQVTITHERAHADAEIRSQP